MGDKSFEDRSRQLKDLPLLSTDFYSWLNLTVSSCMTDMKHFFRKSLPVFPLATFFQKIQKTKTFWAEVLKFLLLLNFSENLLLQNVKTEWNFPFLELQAQIRVLQCVVLSCIQDWERLHAASWDLQTYRDMLQWKKQQLEEEQKEQMEGHAAQKTLLRRIGHIQLDLRDLMKQIHSQVPTLIHIYSYFNK